MRLFFLTGLFLLASLCLWAKSERIELEFADFKGEFKEANWRDAFAKFLENKGSKVKTEVSCKGGRCDILTEKFAIEVDSAAKWHEAIGQACHYSLMLKTPAAIALYDWQTLSADKREALERTAARRKIKAFFLTIKK